jgi:AcrR family transcriptional regulator
MRDIAVLSGVGLSNIYNYFPSKDEIFNKLIEPLLHEFDKTLQSHHDIQYPDQFVEFLNSDNDRLLSAHTREYLSLLRTHRRRMELLLLKAQGSSLENFMDVFTERCTDCVCEFMEKFVTFHPEFDLHCSRFTYHMHTV